LGAFVELVLEVDDVLFERGDPALQLVDVGGRPESGLGPDLFAQDLRESLFQLPDAAGEAAVALVCVGPIRLEGGPADRGMPVVRGWGCGCRVDPFQ
jgi:hypothetical protein